MDSRLVTPSRPVSAVLFLTLLGLGLCPGPERPRTLRAAEATPAPDRLLATGQGQGTAGNYGLPQDGQGDDGDLAAGRAPAYRFAAVITPTTPAENLVVDENTGLMWVRSLGILNQEDGEGVHANRRLDQALRWQDAIDVANQLRYGGFDDWRLPNINELQTLVEFDHYASVLNPEAFPEPFTTLPSPYFWSSTTGDRDPSQAYYLNVYDGHAYPWTKDYYFALRPVREVSVTDPVAIMATGQAKGYGGNRGGTEAGNGDDGDLQRGLKPDYAWSDDGQIDTPSENVLTDRNTGLIWLRDPLLIRGDRDAGEVDLQHRMDWATAVQSCAKLNYAGHDDWRLPNINELISITQPGRPGSSVDPVAFPNAPIPLTDPKTPWVWWSGTTAAVARDGQPTGSEAWFISTGTPIIRHHVGPDFTPAKARPAYARCVRDVVARDLPESYRREIRSSADWEAMTLPSTAENVERVGKFIVPVDAITSAPSAASASSPLGHSPMEPNDPDPPFRAAFQDVKRFPLHYDFLRTTFPDLFGTLTFAEYTQLVSPRASRRYLAGGLRAFSTGDGTRAYGFDVFIDSDADPDLLTQAETTGLYHRLKAVFRRRPLVYSPTQPGAIARAATWKQAAFKVDYPADAPPPDFEAYTTGDAYGTVRLLTLTELAAAQAEGRLSWQDIIVLDHAPTDLEGVVAGIVTGDRQGDLSHLAVRTARRGTPNAYVKDPHTTLASYAGRLVRLTVTRAGYQVAPDVTLAEAQAFWDAHRPAPVAIQRADLTFDRLDDLTELAAGDTGRTLTAKVGGKAANLARLYAFLPARYQVAGFAIPFKPYADFMAATTITDTGGSQPVRRTLAEVVTRLHADDRFLADSTYRAARLGELRTWIEKSGDVPDALVSTLASRIEARFGPHTMVRFRSSSNAEDGLEFNGAGLYDSTSVCAADSLDDDNVGPSRCDAGQPNERTIARGLRRVWSSVWNARAWDERAYWGIDQTAVGMAILVTTAFPDERANGVAFTGNPANPASREYVVNVQIGDTSVVLPDPGTLPERDLLTVVGGQVTQIRRALASSLVPPGTTVLSDDELRELGGVMADAAGRFPLDLGSHRREEVMLDFEFKLRNDGNQLLFKQVRPFLATTDSGGGAVSAVRIETPEAQDVCAMWRINHAISSEYNAKVRLSLKPGLFTVALDGGQPSPPDLFGDLRYGGQQQLATPLGPASVDVSALPDQPNRRVVTVSRTYLGTSPITVTLTLPVVRAGELSVFRVDDAFLTTGTPLVALGSPGEQLQFLAPCGLPGLAPERLQLTFNDGQSATLDLRKGAGGGFWAGYLFAELVHAKVKLAAGEREVSGYANLVYDAERHNWNEGFWILFDPPAPLGAAHGLWIRQRYQGDGRETFDAALLGPDLEPLARPSLQVVSARRWKPDEAFPGLALLPWTAR